jgi:hypothetical protein
LWIGFDDVDVLPTNQPENPPALVPDNDPASGAGRKEEIYGMLGADGETDGNGITIKEEDNQSGEDTATSKLDLAHNQKEALRTAVTKTSCLKREIHNWILPAIRK